MAKGLDRPSEPYATKSCSVPPTRNATGCKDERARRSSEGTSRNAITEEPFQVLCDQSTFASGHQSRDTQT